MQKIKNNDGLSLRFSKKDQRMEQRTEQGLANRRDNGGDHLGPLVVQKTKKVYSKGIS